MSAAGVLLLLLFVDGAHSGCHAVVHYDRDELASRLACWLACWPATATRAVILRPATATACPERLFGAVGHSSKAAPKSASSGQLGRSNLGRALATLCVVSGLAGRSASRRRVANFGRFNWAAGGAYLFWWPNNSASSSSSSDASGGKQHARQPDSD